MVRMKSSIHAEIDDINRCDTQTHMYDVNINERRHDITMDSPIQTRPSSPSHRNVFEGIRIKFRILQNNSALAEVPNVRSIGEDIAEMWSREGGELREIDRWLGMWRRMAS
jgi:hypothetical protein